MKNRYKLWTGDCREVVGYGYAENTFDSIISDPPYGLEFMDKAWDRGVPGVEFWTHALRVAKPGAYLLAFGGTRTFHRLACAIEDAGWEIRDCIMWVYGSGFPKSHNIGKAIDREAGAVREVIGTREQAPKFNVAVTGSGANTGYNRRLEEGAPSTFDITAPATDAAKQWEGWGTALKPAWEPIIVAQKPMKTTVATNVLKYGTGGLNIDGCRVGTWTHAIIGGGGGEGTGWGKKNEIYAEKTGRFPANVIHDGSEEVLALFPVTKPTIQRLPNDKTPTGNGITHGAMPGIASVRGPNDAGGSAARYFYCAKASTKDRFMHLTCACETVKLCAWAKEDRSHSAPTDSTSPEQGTCVETEADVSFCSTSVSGSRHTDQSRKATASITSTETNKTTGSKTSSSSHQRNTNDSTAAVKSETDNGSNHVVFVGDCFHSLPSTTICPPKDGRFTGVVVGATSPLWSVASKCESCGSDIKKTVHPTQKPEALMRYLIRLATPPNGIVLDPFCGSGSTGKAAMLEGARFVGVDLDPEYVAIAKARIEHALATTTEEEE